MYMSERCISERGGVEGIKELGYEFAEFPFDDFDGENTGERWDTILEVFNLNDVFFGNDSDTGGKSCPTWCVFI